MKNSDSCYYPHRSIGTMQSLALHLGMPLDTLKMISENAHKYYVANRPVMKKNGDVRITYTILEPLKTIQKKIQNNLLKKVHYPDYLQGSLKGRSPITNAEKHLGAAIIIKEDIKKFFDSISYEKILIIWKHFFCFSDEVAHCLTRIITFKGFLSQGCSTSSYIANLIFWEVEPKIVSTFAKQGIVYTRYVDDITLSSKNILCNEQLATCTKRIYSMLLLNGLKPNYSKHKIITKRNKLSINNININSPHLTIAKKYRKNTKAAIKCFNEIVNDEYLKKKMYPAIMGRLNYIKNCHPHFVSECKTHLNSLQNPPPSKK